jgi:hypothetical protein
LGIIENKELWATKTHFMNDSSEFRIAFDMVQDRLTDEIGTDKLVSAVADPNLSSLSGRQRRTYILWKGIERIINVNICVVCFCASGDLLSQWRGYSGGYGFSIGFNLQRLQALGNNLDFLLGPCIYEGRTQQNIIAELCDHHLQDNDIINYDTAQKFSTRS